MVYKKLILTFDNLQSNEKEIRHLIKDDYLNNRNTKYYINSQIEGQDENEISNLVKNTNPKLTKEEQLLSVLSLLRIVFYPEKEDEFFAVLDYTIDENLTDDLLVVKVLKNSNVKIVIES